MPLKPRVRVLKKSKNITSFSNDDIAKYAKIWARQFVGRVPTFKFIQDELGQEAAIGIMRGMKTHDPKRGSALSYLWLWAHEYMKRHANKLGGVVGTQQRAILHSAELADYEADEPTLSSPNEIELPSQEDYVYFNEVLKNYRGRAHGMLLQRALGEGLNSIGKMYGVSGECARMVLAKECRRMSRLAAHGVDLK